MQVELRAVLSGKPVKVLDRELAKKHYNWADIAESFIHIYRQVASRQKQPGTPKGYAEVA